MEFTYGDLKYEKRPLTEDIALQVLTDRIPYGDKETKAFEKLVEPYKIGELAAQQDSCPVSGLKELRSRVAFLKNRYEGFRIRHAQLSGVAAVDGTIDGIDEETAAFLIAAGSIAVIAKGYGNNADRVLLANGILPLISDRSFADHPFILIKDFKRDLRTGNTEAYIITPEKAEPISVSIGLYTDEEFEKILN